VTVVAVLALTFGQPIQQDGALRIHIKAQLGRTSFCDFQRNLRRDSPTSRDALRAGRIRTLKDPPITTSASVHNSHRCWHKESPNPSSTSSTSLTPAHHRKLSMMLSHHFGHTITAEVSLS